MKKNFIIGFVCGAIIFSAAGVLAGQYIATENPFPIQFNGNNISLEGYNIEGSTYFKLRDIADALGNFNVGFNDNTIQLSTDGYQYESNSSNKYNYTGYTDVSGRTIQEVADKHGLTLEEFLETYNLPADMPPDTIESVAYNLIPFKVMAQTYGQTTEELKEILGLGNNVTDDTPWGEAIDNATLGNYVGVEHLEEFKAYYGLDDSVNADTLWRDVRRQVEEVQMRERIESEK